jgi:hypothetical protein
MALHAAVLQQAIHNAGHTWIARTPPATEHHGLGRLAPDPQKVAAAAAKADLMLKARIHLVPPGLAEPESVSPLSPEAAKVSFAAAAASIPKDMDWRTRGIIGPVRDQGWCGSCVSFCTTGLAAAMAWLELGTRDLILSAADQHFCSSHGANCGGWNEADALGQIKSRGVVPEESSPT